MSKSSDLIQTAKQHTLTVKNREGKTLFDLSLLVTIILCVITPQLVGLALNSAFFATPDPLVTLLPVAAALGTLLLGILLTRIPLHIGALPFSYPFLVFLFTLITIGSLLGILSSWSVAGRMGREKLGNSVLPSRRRS